MNGPSPDEPYPMKGFPQVGFLRPLLKAKSNIVVGEYTYYDDPDGPEHFAEKCVLYHFDFVGDKLVIGKYCALARGVRFIMNGANHSLGGFSTYPFFIFGNGWEPAALAEIPSASRGDTVVGNDVWVGTCATILPGVKIGDGAVVAAHAVVSRDVPAYAIVAGNPARVVKMRFDEATVAELLRIAWWDRSAEWVTRNIQAIVGANLAALRE